MLIFLIFLFYPELIESGLKCPDYSPQVSCLYQPTLYIFDETDYLGVEGFQSEMTFFQQHMIPIFDWNSTVFQDNEGKMVSTRMLADFVQAQLVGGENDVCFALQQVQAQYNAHISLSGSNNNLIKEAAYSMTARVEGGVFRTTDAGHSCMVKSSMKWAESMSEHGGFPTKIVMFASTQNKTEIQQAGNYFTKNRKSENFIVVAMRNADFSNFPALQVFNVYDLYYAPYCLAWAIQSEICQGFSCVDCPCPGDSGSSSPPSTSRPITTTPAPTRAPTPWDPMNPKCNCQWDSVWNDVIFLFDGSASSSEMGLDEMWATAQTWLAFFNVQKRSYTASNYFMQVGFMVYGANVTIISELGDWDGDQVLNLAQLPYNGDEISNVELAIRKAADQFESSNGRTSSRQVIVILATSYNAAGDDNGIQAAQTFKEGNGIVIVYNYIEAHGEPSPKLSLLASNGYFFTNLNSSPDDLQNAQCDANCFCLNEYTSASSSIRGTPTEGCYSFALTPANYVAARNKCSLFGNATLPVDESAQKTAFFRSNIAQSFWVGLTFNYGKGGWFWENGQSLNQTYTPWAPTARIDGANNQSCVFVGPNDLWYTSDFRNGYNYPCEMAPCDSTRFCHQSF